MAHCGRAKRERDVLHRSSCERSELSGVFNGTDFLNLFQAIRSAINVLNVSMCIILISAHCANVTGSMICHTNLRPPM